MKSLKHSNDVIAFQVSCWFPSQKLCWPMLPPVWTRQDQLFCAKGELKSIKKEVSRYKVEHSTPEDKAWASNILNVILLNESWGDINSKFWLFWCYFSFARICSHHEISFRKYQRPCVHQGGLLLQPSAAVAACLHRRHHSVSPKFSWMPSPKPPMSYVRRKRKCARSPKPLWPFAADPTSAWPVGFRKMVK